MLAKNSRNYSDQNRGRVRQLRSESGASEQIVWEFLRKKRTGYVFRRQHPVGPYVLDFYCPQAMLCVEVDGEHHALREESDNRRDEYLAGVGILTIRIPSLEIFDETGKPLAKWIQIITYHCDERTRA